MNDRLSEYGEAWRAAQPAPPAVDLARLRPGRGSRAAVAAAGVLAVACAVTAVAVAGVSSGPVAAPAVLGPAVGGSTVPACRAADLSVVRVEPGYMLPGQPAQSHGAGARLGTRIVVAPRTGSCALDGRPAADVHDTPYEPRVPYRGPGIAPLPTAGDTPFDAGLPAGGIVSPASPGEVILDLGPACVSSGLVIVGSVDLHLAGGILPVQLPQTPAQVSCSEGFHPAVSTWAVLPASAPACAATGLVVLRTDSVLDGPGELGLVIAPSGSPCTVAGHPAVTATDLRGEQGQVVTMPVTATPGTGSAPGITISAGAPGLVLLSEANACLTPFGVTAGVLTVDVAGGALTHALTPRLDVTCGLTVGAWTRADPPAMPTPTPTSPVCAVDQLAGSIDHHDHAGGTSAYEIALTNVGATACQLDGQPRGLTGVRADGTTIPIPLIPEQGPHQDPRTPGAAAPGRPEHLLLESGSDCYRPSDPGPFVRLLLQVAGGTVAIDGRTAGSVDLPCATTSSRFYGPVSALTGTAPPALPLGRACRADEVTVTAVQRHVLAGLDPYELAVRPTAGGCVLRAGETSVDGATTTSDPAGVVATATQPAYALLSFESDSGCPPEQHRLPLPHLVLHLGAGDVSVAPPPGQAVFTLCGDLSVSLATGPSGR